MQAIELTRPFRVGSTRFRALMRRFRRDPEVGAFGEIRDRLARAASVRDVGVADIAAIAGAWNVAPDGPLTRRTVGLYRDLLRDCLDDHRLTEAELADLDHLRRALHLTCEDAELANRQVARELYARSVDEVLTDATIDPDERVFLTGLRDALGVPRAVADNIEAMKRMQLGARNHIPPKRAELP